MTSERVDIKRRQFVTGRLPDPLLISSAVVHAFPERAQAVARALAGLPGTEVHAVSGAKIVIVLEGWASGEIGARLAEIALMDGVLAANLVYEQTMTANEENDAQQT
jgi:nitrate reductase NapD